MKILNVPIVDFYKYCLNSAYESGYKWVVCLLARERDVDYSEIRDCWASLHDLTGEDILFVFTGANWNPMKHGSLIYDNIDGFYGVESESLHIANNQKLKMKHKNNTSPTLTDEMYEEVRDNHTQSITALKNYFNLPETEIPSLIFTPTYEAARDLKVVIPVIPGKIYSKMRKIIIAFEDHPFLNNYDEEQNKIQYYIEMKKMLEENLLPHHNLQSNSMPTHFKVAFSFPGECRKKVEEVVNELSKKMPQEHIFYDRFYEAYLARPNLDLYLQNIYKDKSDLIVVFLCEKYNEKNWCGVEWRAIRNVLNSKETKDDQIMFIRCGLGEVEGVFGGLDGYIDAERETSKDIADQIWKRYESLKKEN